MDSNPALQVQHYNLNTLKKCPGCVCFSSGGASIFFKLPVNVSCVAMLKASCSLLPHSGQGLASSLLLSSFLTITAFEGKKIQFPFLPC